MSRELEKMEAPQPVHSASTESSVWSDLAAQHYTPGTVQEARVSRAPAPEPPLPPIILGPSEGAHGGGEDNNDHNDWSHGGLGNGGRWVKPVYPLD